MVRQPRAGGRPPARRDLRGGRPRRHAAAYGGSVSAAAHYSAKDNLFLIGYRGAGKTCVGAIVADRLRRPFVDLDALIERTAGLSIRDLFEQHGEPAFRDLEQQTLAHVCADSSQVVSVGGGAVLREENRKRMKACGRCIWLRAATEELATRLAADPKTAAQRPALTARGVLEEIEEQLAQRAPLYERLADTIVDTTGRSIEAVAGEIVAWALKLAR
ncbi:MAG: shikimate kinase [Planctomycetota bacterium]|nr:MAG: shikimate kinase [Planctomycetota bacterium]